MSQLTQIDILRHGLPEGDGHFRGVTDFAITEQGLAQMATAIADITELEAVVSSPLQRCSQFARQYAQEKALPMTLQKEWQELDFGDWDGHSQQQIWQQYSKELESYWQDPWSHTPHKGETLVDFDQRIKGAWQSLLAQHHGKKILVVTHAGVMRQLLRQLLEMPQTAGFLQRLHLPYASRLRVTVYHDDNGQDWPQVQLPISQDFEQK
ncbi:alpha-ribazole phosphatase [Photobacterium jeanii]|uniref:Alpha-ribazole phosphatase n=1 Tax=Photobacterium jeanii TaxID=858640 RepID=A0A178K7C6_9GAMM|nr:histidine phosphatase family protein [Photobacterium jeanii]OAN12976.1 alpha-ribazole phosphatase [Photobacterium jeanii]PST89123.1 histidine phosphatase family protein [Photobacterium jeanii]